MRKQIPVVVVAGYLGSGKTTLLNHLLRNNGGTRIGVVVNDFGAINIDSMLVAGQVDSMVSLGNGCLCCAVDVSEMDGLFDQLTGPKSPIDVIVVEASGLAEPQSLIRLVLGSANKRIAYGGLVEMVDAAEFVETRARHPEVDQHLALADLIVLNKSDRVDAQQLSALEDLIGSVVGAVPIVVTRNGTLDPTLLFDRRALDEKPTVAEQLTLDQLIEHDYHEHLHDAYDSVEFTSADALDPHALIELLEDPPRGLFRAKGFLHFAVAGEKRKFVLHVVGRHIRLHPTRWARGETRRSQIVAIGTGMDEPELRDRLQRSVHTGADPLGGDAMLTLQRYLVD